MSKNAVTDLSAEEALTFVASFYRLNPTKVGHAVAVGFLRGQHCSREQGKDEDNDRSAHERPPKARILLACRARAYKACRGSAESRRQWT